MNTAIVLGYRMAMGSSSAAARATRRNVRRASRRFAVGRMSRASARAMLVHAEAHEAMRYDRESREIMADIEALGVSREDVREAVGRTAEPRSAG